MRRRKNLSRSLPLVMTGGIVALMAGTLWFLYQKSRPKAAPVETEQPVMTSIEKKTVAAGAIEPRQEVEIKPKVAGILKILHVKPGDKVKTGDLIGEVQIIPDPVGLNDAELRLRSAVLRQERAKRELDRILPLTERGAMSITDLDQARTEYELATEESTTARMRVELMRSGAIKRSKGAATQIESTVSGTVLSLPIKEGSSVINANSFNPGNTVAFVADMTDMIFKGTIDESEVGKLEVGMPVEIVIGALSDRRFEGMLEFVAPKNVDRGDSGGNSNSGGTTEYAIEAAFRIPENVMVRAGYSANANIVLERRENVIAISESALIFDGGKVFVEVEAGSDTYARREVNLGLSDGIMVEILDGVKMGETLRKPDPTTAPTRSSAMRRRR